MPLLTPEQVAEVLSISVRHLLHLTSDGEIPFVNVGRGLRMIRRYDATDIQAFIESRKVTEARHNRTALSMKLAIKNCAYGLATT